jgi:hypothetical protein
MIVEVEGAVFESNEDRKEPEVQIDQIEGTKEYEERSSQSKLRYQTSCQYLLIYLILISPVIIIDSLFLSGILSVEEAKECCPEGGVLNQTTHNCCIYNERTSSIVCVESKQDCQTITTGPLMIAITFSLVSMCTPAFASNLIREKVVVPLGLFIVSLLSFIGNIIFAAL